MSEYFTLKNGQRICYQHLKARKDNQARSGIVFLHGFRSDMQGDKVSYLRQFCEQEELEFLAFEVRGHGNSDGKYIDYHIGDWLKDAIEIINALTSGPQIIVGSSMGGWLAMLYALANPDKVHALVLIAAAFDFPSKITSKRLSEADKQELSEKGIVTVHPSYASVPFQLRKSFFDNSLKYNLLDSDEIEINCPVHLLHGTLDDVVLPIWSEKIMKRLSSSQVILHYVKDGDHRLSRPQDMAFMVGLIEQLL